jgi:hypothetical protein
VETIAVHGGRGRRVLRLAWAWALRLELPVLAIWVAAGAGLAAITTKVVDWFVMTDELLYERLAISVAHLHDPLPHLRGELVPNGSQLYPVLLSTVYRHGLVPASLHDAHVLNAYVMTSAAVPAFLLARSVTRRRGVSYLVAALSVLVPWMVFASFLLTEVAAYPAFLWAILGIQHATVSPRARNDVLALVGIGVATLARTQFFALVLVLAAAILVHELAYAPSGPRRLDRVRAALRSAVSGHRVLAGFAAVLAVALLGLTAAGSLSSALGTYADSIEGNPFPAHFVPSLAEHVAMIALGLGVLPFLVGVGWLVGGLARASTRERQAFAAVGTATLVVLAFEVTSFDLRFGGGVVRERYLFYVVPVILVGLVAALTDVSWPRWSLLAPTIALVYGFAEAGLPTYVKLNVDTPISTLDDRILALAHSLAHARIALAVGTVLLAGLFVEASLLMRRTHLAIALAVLTAVTLPLETRYAFQRLFAVDGTSGRPLTLDQGVVFNWVDRTLGPDASATMVPFPVNYADYWASVGWWWDLEFWNESVTRSAYVPGQYLWTPTTFPRVMLRFDPKTGLASSSPTPYVIESDKETRFRIAGPVTQGSPDQRDSMIIAAVRPWRAEWVTYGMYDDGWTRPNRIARIRIFAAPGQKGPVTRTLTLGVQAPTGIAARPFRVVSNLASVRSSADDTDRVLAVLHACVPAHGYTDVRLVSPVHSTTYGDPTNQGTSTLPRQAGVHLTEIAVADEIGPACRPGPGSS